MDKLLDGVDLNAKETEQAFLTLLNDPIRCAGFLSLLKAKGESVEEILGLVQALRSQMKRLEVGYPVMDIVGTGGDQAGTVNISTGSALLAAQCGIPVMKHGNRAVSSKTGSADVLEALGYDIHKNPKKSLEQTGFGFCFAPDYHPALQRLRSMRRALKMPTALNLIGPLLNPAGLDHVLLGVYPETLAEKIAEVLFRLGTKRSLVFSGCGIDELSCMGKTEGFLVTEQSIEKIVIDPQELGLARCTLQDLKGGDAKMNASLLKRPPRALRDTLILNAGVALFLYGKTKSIQEGIALARVQCMKNQLRGVIAEIKRASPSAGFIGAIDDPAKRAREFEKAGAAVISVLTSERFQGSLKDLEQVREAVDIPVLRKDFITSKEDLSRTKADLVLLIVAFLGSHTKEMIDEAKRLGILPIVEVHNEEELNIALAAGADVIGVNQRNLKDFTMHPEVYKLIEKIPQKALKIAESGVESAERAEELFQMGYDAILVGSALTRNPKLCEELCSLKSAG